MKRVTGIFSTDILLDIWETRVGRVLRVFGLDRVRTTIFTLAVLATLIPSLATGYLSYRQNVRAIRAKLNEQLSSVSGQAVREVALWLRERQYDLRVFSTSYEVTDNVERATPQTRQRLSDYLGSVNDRFVDYDELLVVTSDRRTVATSGRGSGQLNLTGDWIQQARAGDPVFGEPMRPDSGGTATMEIAVPIVSPSGRFLGVLGGRLNFHGVEQILGELRGSGALRVLIVQRDGKVIAAAGATSSTYPASALEALAKGDSVSVPYDAPDGLAVVGVRNEIARTEWSAVAEIPEALAFADISRLRNATVLLTLVLLAVSASLAYGLGLLIVRPLDRLSRAAQRVAGGDLSVSVPASGGGELTELTGVFNDMVRELRHGRDELERLSVTDPLTGLANRRQLATELDRELVRSARQEHPAAILMLDVDHFKEFNDTRGHQVGDTVLQRLAITMRQAVRELDIVARYGGEEFLVILPETPAAEAMQVAERIRADAEKDRFTLEGGDEVAVTVSIGVAIFPEDAVTAEALIAAADKALYASKAAGRNRVTGPSRKSSGKKR